jgi:hypothetical protein
MVACSRSGIGTQRFWRQLRAGRADPHFWCSLTKSMAVDWVEEGGSLHFAHMTDREPSSKRKGWDDLLIKMLSL